MSDEPSPDRNLRTPLGTLRGAFALAFAGVVLLVSDVLQRTIVVGAARLFPKARRRILTAWIQAMRMVVLDIGTVFLGGARMTPPPRIPSRPGVLVIMNHQSLLDIPLVVRAMQEAFPRIVTRRRYTRGIPLISHMTRLYQYPLVDPEATVKGDLKGLQEAATSGDSALVIFPEGTRSRTGELSPWRRSGLRVILSSRTWDVYVAVADGLWRSRNLADFVRDVSNVAITMVHLGPYPSPPTEGPMDEFIDGLEASMKRALSDLRAGRA